MSGDDDSGETLSEVHDSLNDEMNTINSLSDGEGQLRDAWESLAAARQYIRQHAAGRDDMDVEEVTKS